MKNLTYSLLFVFTLTFGFAQTKSEKKARKAKEGLKEYEATKALIESGIYNFEAQWVNPMSGQRVSLTNSPNYLKIDKDSANIALPFFGVAHSATIGLNGKGGINFIGKIEKYSVEHDDKKQKITVKFNTLDANENLDFTITVFKNRNTSVFLISSIRNSISYDGKVMIPKKE